MSTESLKEERPEKETFKSINQAQEFAENIADSIKTGLKQAPKVFVPDSREDSDNNEADSTKYKGRIDPGKARSEDTIGTAIDYRPYGIDDINLRNEAVQEKKRAIRVESSEDRDLLSDAIQRRLEAKVFGVAKVHE